VTTDTIHRLATGFLHVPVSEQRTGRMGLVGVRGETGLELMRAVPRWDEATLVAIALDIRAFSPQRWPSRRRVVWTRTVETAIVLGTGAVQTATTNQSGICDLIGVKPAGAAGRAWLDRIPVAHATGLLVRLELHHTPSARGTVPRA
jgi:hypothetical protein